MKLRGEDRWRLSWARALCPEQPMCISPSHTPFSRREAGVRRPFAPGSVDTLSPKIEVPYQSVRRIQWVPVWGAITATLEMLLKSEGHSSNRRAVLSTIQVVLSKLTARIFPADIFLGCKLSLVCKTFSWGKPAQLILGRKLCVHTTLSESPQTCSKV